MTDPMLTALWDAIERRSTEDATELDRARRIREDRAHADRYQFGNPEAIFLRKEAAALNKKKRKKP